MTYKTPLIWGCIFALMGVVLGAFGSHGLANLLESAGRTQTFETAVRYQFYHAFGLLASGILMKVDPAMSLRAVVICFITGVFCFSGSLYLICFTTIKWLWPITPTGGLFFIAGWATLLLRLIRK